VEEGLAAGELPLIVGLAVRGAAAELTGRVDVQLKWPNDVQFGGRKLAGILCERVDKVDLIGVGLNVNLEPGDAPLSLRGAVTSLRAIGGKAVDRNRALVVLGSHVHQMILARRKQGFGHFLAEYEKHHALLGKKVGITNEKSPRVVGKVEGVDGMGRLLVREKGELHRVVAGHVTVM
jgi:BirA family transcriptional regulator, biotin operon repressor / biotin---[acetyl-CoA-carboxylase] ligase